MKQSSTIIPVIIAAVLLPVVLLAAFGFGLYVRKVRQRQRNVESVALQKQKAAAEMKKEQAEITPRPPHDSRQRSRAAVSPEQRDEIRKQIEDIKKQWGNMSEAERQEFRAKMLEMFDARRREASSRYRARPPQEEAGFRDEFMITKKQWDEMSEEERQAFRNKMRERANAIRQGKN